MKTKYINNVIFHLFFLTCGEWKSAEIPSLSKILILNFSFWRKKYATESESQSSRSVRWRKSGSERAVGVVPTRSLTCPSQHKSLKKKSYQIWSISDDDMVEEEEKKEGGAWWRKIGAALVAVGGYEKRELETCWSQARIISGVAATAAPAPTPQVVVFGGAHCCCWLRVWV